MKQYRVWRVSKGIEHAWRISADSVERAAYCMRFKRNGETVAEVDSFDGWELLTDGPTDPFVNPFAR